MNEGRVLGSRFERSNVRDWGASCQEELRGERASNSNGAIAHVENGGLRLWLALPLSCQSRDRHAVNSSSAPMGFDPAPSQTLDRIIDCLMSRGCRSLTPLGESAQIERHGIVLTLTAARHRLS
jgi:hypothetical protein